MEECEGKGISYGSMLEGTSWKRSLNILAKFKSSCNFPDGFRIIKAQKETSVFASGERKGFFFYFWALLCTSSSSSLHKYDIPYTKQKMNNVQEVAHVSHFCWNLTD